MKRLSIKITSNAKSLSSYSGLHLFNDLISKFEIQTLFGPLVPKKERDRGLTSFQKLYSGILSFIAGAECLDDLDTLAQDPLFYELTDSPASTTMGKYLRLFSFKQIQDIRNKLPRLAFKMRLWLNPSLYRIVFKMDGTIHEQFGEKMEGVEFSYRKINGLSSQNLFDDKVFCYGFALRNGAAHSSVGAIEMMETAFKVVPKSIQKYFVADSVYASTQIYNTLLNNIVNFAICLPETVWGGLLKNYGNKITWRDTNIRFFDSKNCEIGDILYLKKDLSMGKTFLRVVLIRTKKKVIQSGDNHPYHYHAIVTNMSTAEMTNEKIIQFYRKRAQVENNIKDLKNGMDFHHFPCQSLKANTVRKKVVLKACEVIKHARSIELRMMSYFEKEVKRMSMVLGNAFFRTDVRMMSTTNVATHHL